MMTGPVPAALLQKGNKMKKILVYSHDTFGLGNIRRMLAIVQQIAQSMEGVSILIVSGSAVMQTSGCHPVSTTSSCRAWHVMLPAPMRPRRSVFRIGSYSISGPT